MADLRLRSHHEVRGAVFRTEAGWSVPASYGPLGFEVSRVRRGAGLADLSDRRKLVVTGEDRVTFLDGLVTADVKTLDPGSSSYALVLTDKSRVVGDLWLHAFPDRLVLDLEASQAEAVHGHVRRFLVSDDVSFGLLPAAMHLEVIGREAPAFVARALGWDVRGKPSGSFVTFPLDRKTSVHALRTTRFGEPAVVLWSAGGDLRPAWSALDRAGVPAVGREALEVLRIESGLPRVGVDMGQDTLALEAAPDGAISFTKGCYVGQEVVARGTYRGHIRRKLMGLRIFGDVPPARGDPVTLKGAEVGRVTSGAWSPTTGWVVALALVRVDDVPADASLFVDRGGWDLRARLHPLPFVRGSA